MAESLKFRVDRLLRKCQLKIKEMVETYLNFEEECTVIINALMQSDCCDRGFIKPLNKKAFPHYYKVIKEPMFLENILSNLAQHKYASAYQVFTDVRKIIGNCIKFNNLDSLIVHNTILFADLCEELFLNSEKLKKLNQVIPPTDATNFKAKLKLLEPQHMKRLSRIVCLHEGENSGKIKKSSDQLKLSTKRYIYEFIELHGHVVKPLDVSGSVAPPILSLKKDILKMKSNRGSGTANLNIISSAVPNTIPNTVVNSFNLTSESILMKQNNHTQYYTLPSTGSSYTCSSGAHSSSEVNLATNRFPSQKELNKSHLATSNMLTGDLTKSSSVSNTNLVVPGQKPNASSGSLKFKVGHVEYNALDETKSLEFHQNQSFTIPVAKSESTFNSEDAFHIH